MRALMPLQSVVGLWQAYGQVQVPMERISDLLDQVPDRERRGTELPAPAGELRAEAVSYAYPGQGEPLLRNIAFRLPAGEALGVIGPSGSGKSTLARLLVGARAPAKGHVRLDGADVAKWDHVQLGPYLGYLPQDVEIFEGTLAQNVARFTDYSEAALWEAIDRAGLREMVDGLPDGVATRIGDEGVRLSGGQRQRVGLARALFGRPKVLVLDEPDASLDAAGQAALFEALRTLKAEGTTVVIIGHHLRLLRETDKILALRNGQMDYFGPAAKALKKLDPAHSQPAGGGEGGEGEAGTEAAPSSQAGS
jgi:ATP-binding cassette subfamily C exporter for protease/lipase